MINTLVEVAIAAGPGAADTSVLGLGLGALTLISVGAAVWFAGQTRQTGAKLEALQAKYDKGAEERRSLREQDRNSKKSVEGRLQEIASLKKDVASLKKRLKQHSDESDKLRKEAQQARKERDEARETRVAFEAPVKAPKPETPKPEIRPVATEPTPDPGLADKIVSLENEIASLADALSNQKKKTKESATAAETLKREMRQHRRRTEGYRRADLMTKSKMEILHDKLTGLGRRYYDAVSELAALKGEVVPPQKQVISGFESDPTFRSLYDEDTSTEVTPAQEASDEGEAPAKSASNVEQTPASGDTSQPTQQAS